ncbi:MULTISPECIES: chalcone isomerase family protein [unclassified Flavobacterium]|uniref:chalcone isomerase family protein n=1 Tax=unclassified Flavobacterium TaxID=196869 RepID=UPI00360BBCF0
MKRKILMTLLVVMSSFVSQAQTQFEQDGVTIPRTIEVQKKSLQLNGYGTRSKAWIDVYVQALYLSQLSQDAAYILESDADMAIRIQITSKLVTSHKLTKNMENGFEKSCGTNLAAMQPKIDMLKSMLADKIVEKDVFVLAYNTLEDAVFVYKNDQLKGKIPGLDFKKALFGIWLAESPADKDLKEELLGKK